MKPFVKQNILQWHRDQRDRSIALAKAEKHPDKAAGHKRDADRHALIIKDMTS